MTRQTVTRANLVVLAALTGLLALAGLATWERWWAARQARDWVQHTHEVLGTIRELQLSLREAESAQRAFLLTGEDAELPAYEAALGRVGLLQGELQRLTLDNGVAQERLRTLSPLLQRWTATLAQSVELRREAGVEAALRVTRSAAAQQREAQSIALLTTLAQTEQSLLTERLTVSERAVSTLRWLVPGVALLTALALGTAVWMLNRAWRTAYRMEGRQRSLAQRLQTSLDSISQGVGVFGPDHGLQHWNDCFQVLLALPRALLRPGTPYAEFVAPGIPEEGVALESEDQIRHGRVLSPGDHVVYERLRADGHQLEVRRTAMAGGGFVLTVSDMTQRVRTERVLREAQKMQAIGQLTGGIAHDFNNLLMVILGNLDFVRSRLEQAGAGMGAGVGAEGGQLLRRIERAAWAAQRGATLTAQLLAFARRQPLAPQPLDLSAILPEMVPLLRRTLGEHIDVRFVDAAGLWPALADAAQLESAVLNLALNARDAMPEGGRLTIELANKVLDEAYARDHAEVAPGNYVMLAVSDTGHGMPREVLERVFEPFFTTKPDGKGTGLGLAMVWGFVKQSAGHVKLYSEPGEGTVVKIYLPRAVATPGAAPRRGDAPVSLPRGTGTVLVVEDEPAVREIAVAILRELGYRVLEAGDGEEGLRLFGENADRIDLLLTDVVLPGQVRGRELAERIAALRPAVRVLYMSGYTENSIIHHGRLDEGVHLLSKPFKREQLAVKVAELLAGAPRPHEG